jgi:hypothetical protein
MFGTNVGQKDRAARAVVGTGLLACSAWRLSRRPGKLLPLLGGLAGVILIFTAATRSCPIYAALGMKTSD